MKTARARTANRGRGRRIIAPGCRVAFPRRRARDQAEHSLRRRWRRPGPSPAMSVRPGRHPVSIFAGSAVAGPWPKWSREGDLQDLSGWTHCRVATSGDWPESGATGAAVSRYTAAGPVAQWQSSGLLIRVSRVRIPPGSPSRGDHGSSLVDGRLRPSTWPDRDLQPRPSRFRGEAVLAFQAAFRRIRDDVGYAATLDLRRRRRAAASPRLDPV